MATPLIIPAPRLAPPEAARRWAALLQQIFEVDPRVPDVPRPDARRRLYYLCFSSKMANAHAFKDAPPERQ